MAQGRARQRFGLSAARVAVAGALLIAPAITGCARQEATPIDSVEETQSAALDVDTLTWDPSALSSAMPGLVGWDRDAGAAGALVALSADGERTVVWEAPDGAGFLPVALDADGPRVLCSMLPADVGSAQVQTLALLDASGSVSTWALPDGYEGVVDATFVQGRPLVIVSHATASDYDTVVGSYTSDGRWEEIAVGGDLPEHQFAERISAIPGTASVALVLKTPGGTDDRDDEALVLATLEGSRLHAYTSAFRDDSLPGAATLWGAEGVVFPRTWREVEGAPVVDLVRAVWRDDQWQEEVLVEAGSIASGIETGEVVTQGSDGTYWVRLADGGEHGGGTSLARLDTATLAPSAALGDLSTFDWFCWLEEVP